MSGRAITQVCPQCQMPLVLPATFVGRTIACSRCGNSMLVSDPAPAAKAVLPPHLANRQPPSPALPVAAAAVQFPPSSPPHVQADKRWVGAPQLPTTAAELADEAHEPEVQPRSCFVTAVIVLSMVVISAASIAGLVILGVWAIRHWPQRDVASSVDDDNAGGKNGGRPVIDKARFTNAARKSASMAGIIVRIDRVETGKVHFRSKGEILETATPNYLIVTLNVKNKSHTEPVEYQSWYDNQFRTDDDEKLDVELIDDDGKTLSLFRIPDAENVERHAVSNSTLPEGDDIFDTLVFKLPEGYLDNPIPPLYLRLPMAAIDQAGYFQFHIPGTMVVRRD